MSKKPKSTSLVDSLWSTADRLRLAKRYYSGELDVLRKARLQAGDLPWRVIRYQRVIDPESLTYPISNFNFVRPKSFEKHLRYLVKDCRVVPLQKLTDAILNNEEIPEKTVAITIDGGWVDSFVHAFKLLHQYQLPYTLFLPTSFIGTNDFFWQDKALFALLWIKKFDGEIEPFAFFPEEIREAIRSNYDGDKLTLPAISMMVNALELVDIESRTLGLSVLMEVMKRKQLSLPEDPSFVSWHEVQMMEKLGASIASMGHSHSFFNELTADQVKADVATAAEILQKQVHHPLPYIAFPAGRFDAAALATLAEIGHKACFAADGVVAPSAQSQEAKAIRRVSMYESICDQTELFMVQLWDLQFVLHDKASS